MVVFVTEYKFISFRFLTLSQQINHDKLLSVILKATFGLLIDEISDARGNRQPNTIATEQYKC